MGIERPKHFLAYGIMLNIQGLGRDEAEAARQWEIGSVRVTNAIVRAAEKLNFLGWRASGAR